MSLAAQFARFLAERAAARWRAGIFRQPSLRARVGAILAVLVFVVAAAIGGVIGQTSVGELRERIGQSLAADASRIADRISREVGARARELTLLAAVDPLHTLRSGAAAQDLLLRLKRGAPAYLWVGITDVQNRVVAASDPAWVGRFFNPRAEIRDVAAAAPGDAGPLVRAALPGPGNPGTEPEELRPITLAYPIRGADGVVSGQVVAQLNWDWVQPVGQSQLTPESTAGLRREAFLIGFRDTVLSGPSPWVGRRLVLPAIARARAGFAGWSVETWPDDATDLTGSAPVAAEPDSGAPDLRWIVLVREPLATAFAPAAELRMVIFEFGLVLAALFAVVGWIVTGRVIAPLRDLTLAADRLRQGDDVELPRLSGPQEIATLANSLRALVATLTSKEVALTEMESLAHHDPLTGLPNRLGLQAWLRRAMQRAHHERVGLLVLVADLDGFKQVNDQLGHPIGDSLLRVVALRLSEMLRPEDVVARLGGDEFVLLLNAPAGIGDQAARGVITRVQERVAAPYQIEGHAVRIGLSLGAACWPGDGDDLTRVLELADAALYAAKRQGKGRVIFHATPELVSTS